MRSIGGGGGEVEDCKEEGGVNLRRWWTLRQKWTVFPKGYDYNCVLHLYVFAYILHAHLVYFTKMTHR